MPLKYLSGWHNMQRLPWKSQLDFEMSVIQFPSGNYYLVASSFSSLTAGEHGSIVHKL